MAERGLEWTTFEFQCWKYLVLGICTRIVALLLYIFQFPILLALICIVRGRTWTRVNNIWISVLKVSSTWDLHSCSSSATLHFPIPYIDCSDLYRSWPNVHSSEQHLNFSVESSSAWDLHSYSSSATLHFPIPWDFHSYSLALLASLFPIPYIARSDLYRSWLNVDSSEQHLNFSVERI